MKRKSKKRLLLSLSGALTAVAIPAITVVSCSKDEPNATTKKQTANSQTTKNSPANTFSTNVAQINKPAAKPPSVPQNTNVIGGANQVSQPLPSTPIKTDAQEIKEELSKVSDNFTLSVSADIGSNLIKSNDLGIIENSDFTYSYAHSPIINNGLFDILVSVHKKNSATKKQSKTIKVQIINLDESKAPILNNTNPSLIEEVKSDLTDLKFDNSLSWVNLQNGSIQDKSGLAGSGSFISIDADESITNNFTYEKFKKLFSISNQENLEFELEHKEDEFDSKGVFLKTTNKLVNDFKSLTNNKKYLDYRLQIYARSKEGNKKKWLRSIGVSFRDETKPLLSLKNNRSNISTLGKVEDKGFYDLSPEYNKGELFIPVGWNNQGKDLIDWVKEQFVLTDINEGTGLSAPQLSVKWAFESNKITNFDRTHAPELLIIEGTDNLSSNKADYMMYLHVSVIKADQPVSIIENYDTRAMRRYNAQNENGIDVIEINKSDIVSMGWDKVYDEIKKIFKVLDMNYYDNFSNDKLARLKFPDVQSPLNTFASEIDIDINIEGVLTNIADSENSKPIKIRIIDDSLSP